MSSSTPRCVVRHASETFNHSFFSHVITFANSQRLDLSSTRPGHHESSTTTARSLRLPQEPILYQSPQGVTEVAQVLFSTGESHRIAQANPLSAHIRIPLTWYHSATFAEFPDETATSIRRVYENPFERHTRRTFCGVCGTPLTYWSEQPRTEADYIQVTMGSLSREDLGDLEDLGLIPESPIEAPQFDIPAIAGRQATSPGDATSDPVATTSTALHPTGTYRETVGVPWFESIIEGSSLGGRLRTTRGTRQSADGLTKFEIEITEFNDDGTEASQSSGNNGKRKLGDRTDVEEMEGISQE